jgi:hypothetical protein
LGAGVAAIGACSSSAIPQAIISANVQEVPGGGMCNSLEEFMYVPAMGPECTAVGCGNGPETSNNSNIVVTGTGDFQITECSIVPSNGAYQVALSAQISGGTQPGTLTISGLFTPRGRAPGDAGIPNADGTAIPNITMEYTDPTKQLLGKGCTAQYVYPDNGAPGTTSLPDEADTYADSNGGRIWLSVFCQAGMGGTTVTNLLETSKPGNSGCETYTTLRVENCSNKSAN